MMKRPSRLPITVPAAALFLAVSYISPPTTSSVPRPSQAVPDLEEVRALHQMAGWVAGTSGLRALHTRDLDGALGQEVGSFELFERPARKEEAPEGRVLAGMPFGEAISDAARRNRVDGLLLAAVVETESHFLPKAVSPRGARGLMQVMPATGGIDAKDLFDPHVNLEVGSRYLGALIDQYEGDLELALAAYNAGPATVARFGGVPPYRETRDYVERVLDCYLRHRQAVAALALAGEGRSSPRRAEAHARARARRPLPPRPVAATATVARSATTSPVAPLATVAR